MSMKVNPRQQKTARRHVKVVLEPHSQREKFGVCSRRDSSALAPA